MSANQIFFPRFLIDLKHAIVQIYVRMPVIHATADPSNKSIEKFINTKCNDRTITTVFSFIQLLHYRFINCENLDIN